MEYSGYCRKCRKHFKAPTNFDEKQFLHCPDCGNRMVLQFVSLEQSIKELNLSKSEIGNGVASVR